MPINTTFEERVKLCINAMRAFDHTPESCTGSIPKPLYELLKQHGMAVINEAQFRILTYRRHTFITHSEPRLGSAFKGEGPEPVCQRCGLVMRSEIHIRDIKTPRHIAVPRESKKRRRLPSPTSNPNQAGIET